MIEKMTRLLELREQLNQIQNFSYSFYQLNKRYPVDGLQDHQMTALIEYYEDLMDKIKKLVS